MRVSVSFQVVFTGGDYIINKRRNYEQTYKSLLRKLMDLNTHTHREREGETQIGIIDRQIEF